MKSLTLIVEDYREKSPNQYYRGALELTIEVGPHLCQDFVSMPWIFLTR